MTSLLSNSAILPRLQVLPAMDELSIVICSESLGKHLWDFVLTSAVASFYFCLWEKWMKDLLMGLYFAGATILAKKCESATLPI